MAELDANVTLGENAALSQSVAIFRAYATAQIESCADPTVGAAAV